MSRLAQRIAKLTRLRQERERVLVLAAPDWSWTGQARKPLAVLGLGRKLSEGEAARLLAEAVAEWEAEQKAAQGAQEAAGGSNVPEPSPPPSPLREDA